jgi:aminoglycoside phosphotransferase (APT) family kinase protein
VVGLLSRPWDPEREVGPDEGRALLALRRPDLAAERVEPLGAGFDATAYLVDGAWVARFPRRAVAVGWLEGEARVMPRLAARLPLPVPAPALAVAPDGGFPWPFSVHRWLPGLTADRAAPDDAGRARLAAPLGRFLAALHAIGPAEARAIGAGEDPMGRFDVPRRTARAHDGLDRLAALGLGDHRAAIEPALAGARGRRPARAANLVHGDLYARHLLLDGDGALSGVIDWGDVHLGDPATDLAIVHTFLPPPARRAFLACYGPVDEDAWALARFRAAYHSVLVALYAQEVADGPLLTEALSGMERIAGERALL